MSLATSDKILETDHDLANYVVSIDDFSFREQVSGDEEVGIWIANQISTGRVCLIKQIQVESLTDEQKRLYISEVNAFSQCVHPFVTPFIGFTKDSPYCVITAYRENSSLCSALQRGQLNGTQLTAIAFAISCGMKRLNELGLAEPNLSTRNILMTQQKLPRICHFNTHARSLKWRAPETVLKDEYTFKSDVFNYAMILYEMVTGKEAFCGWTNEAVTRKLCCERRRPLIPKDTPTPLAELIKRCWHHDPAKRPTFAEIEAQFESGEVFFKGCQPQVVQNIGNRLREKLYPDQKPLTRKTVTFLSNDYSDENGLSVFRNTKSPEFLKALETAHDTLSDGQLMPFFHIIGRVFSSETSHDLLLSVLSSLENLMKRPAAMKAIVRSNVIRYFPYDDPHLLNACLNVLHPIFEAMPAIFQVDFSQILSLILNKSLEKGLILISLFAKSFNTIRSPWNVLDLLIKFERVFLKSDVSYEYISLLFFLCFNFSEFRESRIDACRSIFTHFLDCHDKLTVQLTYKAICTLYDDNFEIPIVRIEQDLCDADLCFPALSLLLRMKTIPPDTELIYSLLNLAQTHKEATLVLLKMIQSSIECAKAMIAKPKWISRKLPTTTDTMRLFLGIMRYKNIRSQVSTVPQIPEFLLALITTEDRVCLIALPSICKRLQFTKDTLQTMTNLHFFTRLFESVDELDDTIITQTSLDIVTRFASIGYTRDFLLIADKLKEYIQEETHIARSAFNAICALNKYPACARLFREIGLEEDVCEIFTGQGDRLKVLEFLRAAP